jgi:hypothetical protein
MVRYTPREKEHYIHPEDFSIKNTKWKLAKLTAMEVIMIKMKIWMRDISTPLLELFSERSGFGDNFNDVQLRSIYKIRSKKV